MHIIYVDESGDDGFNTSGNYPYNQTPTRNFIRVGIIVHDWKWQKIDRAIGDFKYKYHIPKNIELHATEIRNGRKQVYDSRTKKRKSVVSWFGQNYPNRVERENILIECCKLVKTLDLSIIAVVIDKSKIKTTHVNFKTLPKNNSWEYLIERINLFLTESKDQRGMIISDAIQHQIEEQHRNFAKALYSQSMHIDSFHFIESILFEPSESSNLLQLADIISYACHRKFNGSDDKLFEEIQSNILSRNGNISGYGLKIWPE
jgi:hypothetical protein